MVSKKTKVSIDFKKLKEREVFYYKSGMEKPVKLTPDEIESLSTSNINIKKRRIK